MEERMKKCQALRSHVGRVGDGGICTFFTRVTQGVAPELGAANEAPIYTLV